MRYWLKLIGIPSLLFAALLISGYIYFGRTVFVIDHPLCFGTCPAYRVWIFRDGTIVYYGDQFVAHTGIRIGRMDSTQVQQLAAAYSTLIEQIPPVSSSALVASDSIMSRIQLTQNGQTRGITVRDTDGLRFQLTLAFIDQIETAAQIPQWTRGTIHQGTVNELADSRAQRHY
jgi:hypothetical protein